MLPFCFACSLEAPPSPFSSLPIVQVNPTLKKTSLRIIRTVLCAESKLMDVFQAKLVGMSGLTETHSRAFSYRRRSWRTHRGGREFRPLHPTSGAEVRPYG